MSVCAIAEVLLTGGLETSGQRGYSLYWDASRPFWVKIVSMVFFALFFFFLLALGSLQTSLRSIIGESAGSVDMAVGVSVR